MYILLPFIESHFPIPFLSWILMYFKMHVIWNKCMLNNFNVEGKLYIYIYSPLMKKTAPKCVSPFPLLLILNNLIIMT